MTHLTQRSLIITVAILIGVLCAGQAMAINVDKGFFGDRVWWDQNRNGVQEPGEPGINGAVLGYIVDSNQNGIYGDTAPHADFYTGPTPVLITDVQGTVTTGPGTTPTGEVDGIYLVSNLIHGGNAKVWVISLPAGPWVPTYDYDDQAGWQNIVTPGEAIRMITETAVPLPNDPEVTNWVIGKVRDVDFGYYKPSALGDRVWNDVNADGVQDEGEAGLVGWTVTLTGDVDGDGDSDTLTTTTVADGIYNFTNLFPGAYTVTVTPLAGWTQTWDLDYPATPHAASYTLAPGQTFLGVDFGYRQLLGSLGDRVWFDSNADGVQDAGEMGINGVPVVLKGDTNGDNLVDITLNTVTMPGSTPTGELNGIYLFNDLPAGKYVVTVTPAAWLSQTYGLDLPTFPNQGTYNLAAGENTRLVDFGYVLPLGSLGDRVWYDTNKDGIQDPGEPGIDGVLMTLTGVAVTGETITRTTLTGPGTTPDDFSGGVYKFGNLPAGTYNVTCGLGGGYIQTYDLDGIDSANNADRELNPGEEATDVDFGYYLPTATLGDRVWWDQDNDGIQDPDESGINGLTVTLTGDVDGDGDLDTLTQTTAGDGNYLFENLKGGLYTVTVTPPAGATQTYDLDGVATAHTAKYLLGVGETFLDVDFGYRQQALKVCISGTVWQDCDADGIHDTNETFTLAGAVITLRNASGAVVGTVTTGPDGKFSFSNLEPGTYTVTETNPPDYQSTNSVPGRAGTFINKDAIAVAALTGGESYPNQDFLDTGTKPSVELVKTGPSEAKRGDTITYHFKVTNTGNTCLYGGLRVEDPMLGGVIWHKTPVLPGQTFEFDKTYTIPVSGDLTKGWSTCSVSTQCYNPPPPPPCEEKLVNTATAIGCPPLGGTVTDTSSWTVTITSTSCGGYTTYTQGGWGAKPSGNNPGMLLKNNWSKVYGYCGKLYVGTSCRKITFTSAGAVTNYLPAGGTAAKLNYSYTDPSKTSAGVFGGQVTALHLNVDFSNKGITRSGLASLKVQSGSLQGKTVAQVLALCERALAGEWTGYSISTLNDAADRINNCFDNGTQNSGYVK